MVHLHHDNAGPLRVFAFLQPELEAQVHHRDHFPAQIDDTFHVARHLRNRRDVLYSHNLADLQDLDGEVFLSQPKRQILAGSLLGRRCCI